MTVDTIRTICKKLPGTTEGIKWGNDLCFMVAEKMYCVVPINSELTVTLKVRDDEFQDLCETNGIIPAPYAARNKWIQVTDVTVFNTKKWHHYIAQSHQLVASKLSKKKQIELGIVPA